MTDESSHRASLSSLLEEDRESLTAAMKADRSTENITKLLEKETDRLMMRYAQTQADEGRLEAAQQMLQTVRSSVPLVESVRDLEVWQKTAPLQETARRGSTAGTVFSLIGAGMTVIPALVHPSSALVTVAGAVCLLVGGFLFGRSAAQKKAEKGLAGKLPKEGRAELSDSHTQFLVDPDATYHVLKSTLLTADQALENRTGPAAGQETENGEVNGPGSGILSNSAAGGDPSELWRMGSRGAAGSFSSADIDFFGDLLENTYDRRRQDPQNMALTEQIENIRFYLHGKGIETEDYSGPANEKWFEFIPSGGSRTTIRPAFVKDGRLVKKGLASA